MSREELIALKELASINIINILDSLDIEYVDKYNWVSGPCPVHGSSRKDAWSWHLEKGVWRCYSKNCHSHYGSDIFGLIRGIKDINFPESIEIVKALFGGPVDDNNIKELLQIKSNR